MPISRNATPLYRQIIADAWRLTIAHKHLWLFGFFATFIGFGGISEVLFGVFDKINGSLTFASGVNDTPWVMLPGFATFRAIINLSPYPAISIAFFSVTITAIFAVFAWIVSTSIGALVWSTKEIIHGGTPKFGEGLRAGNESFKRVFTINISSKILVWLSFMLTGVNLLHLMTDRTIISAFFFLASYVVFTAIAVIIALISIFATNATVIDRLPVIPSIASALKVIKKHWLISIEMIILLLIINIGFAVAALLMAMILSVPVVFLFLFAAVIQSGPLLTIMMSLTATVLISVIVVAASFVTTFQSAAWTLLWERLNKKGKHHPKLHRLVEWVQRKLQN